MKFSKMQGLGNDFIIFEGPVCNGMAAKALCDRRCGVGADGVIMVLESKIADIRMQIFNSDGSEAEMCGNGVRCFARYASEHGFTDKTEFTVETLAGIQRIKLSGGLVTVNMGKPDFSRAAIPMSGDPKGDYKRQPLFVLDREFTVSSVLMGVPHTTVWVDTLADVDIERYGAAIERLPQFLKKTNVNFAELVNRTAVKVRTFERGCGPTLACGTGSSAVAVCCADAGLTDRAVDVELALGSLHIEWLENSEVLMTGPAEYSFTGEVEI